MIVTMLSGDIRTNGIEASPFRGAGLARRCGPCETGQAERQQQSTAGNGARF